MDGELPPRDYEVGYGKPPRHSRFQPGQSGNPNGRRKGSKNVATLMRDAFDEKVEVTKDGRQRKMTKLELMFMQVANKGAKGEFPSTRLAIDMLHRRDLEEAQMLAAVSRTEERSHSEADVSVLANLSARLFGKQELDDA